MDFKINKETYEYIKDRVSKMSESKSVLNTKVQLVKELYEVFEKHLQEGEKWNTSYRFPEVFGSLQRKYSDLLEAMPECRINAKRNTVKNRVIGANAFYQELDRQSNSQREKSRALMDSLFYGTGILYEGYTKLLQEVYPVDNTDQVKRKKPQAACLYDGLVSERVDIRDFFIDESATVFYDETGVTGARDCARRWIYTYEEFVDKFSGYKNIENVQPVAWGNDPFGLGKIPTEKEGQEQKTMGQYVTVFGYWNRMYDVFCLVANTQIIFVGANPYKHKKLPFVLYYNYRRDDSVWGVSEVEIIAPYVYVKEEMNNLFILDAKLALQPAVAVAGNVAFNPEENELQPGAVFYLRGLTQGKVSDAIAPIRFGGIPAEALTVYKQIEDSQIISTGDDVRALYSNPGQLATQTLAKRESSQKRIKANIMQNTLDSERSRSYIRFSNMMQFMFEPYLDLNGKVKLRRVKVEGYDVLQDNDDAVPEFRQKFGATGFFSVNKKLAEKLDDDIEIEVIDTQMAKQLKDQEVEDIIKLADLAMRYPGTIQGLNTSGLFKQLAKKMDVDFEQLFPYAIDEGKDSVDIMIDLLLLGETPDYNGEIDPERVMERLLAFTKTKIYKKQDKKTQQIFTKFINYVGGFISQYLKSKLKACYEYELPEFIKQGRQAQSQQPTQQGGGANTQEMATRQIPRNSQSGTSQGDEVIPGAGSVAARLGFGST